MNGQGMSSWLYQFASQLQSEHVISKCPVAHVLTVYPHMGLCHGSVKNQFSAGIAFGDIECCTIPSFSHPGQRTASTSLLGSLLFSIFHDGHHLLVYVLVKGTADGPVVRDAHLLPLRVVIGDLLGSLCSSLVEPPSVQQEFFDALCADGKRQDTVQK